MYQGYRFYYYRQLPIWVGLHAPRTRILYFLINYEMFFQTFLTLGYQGKLRSVTFRVTGAL
jgi:hypothetical protein